MVLASDTLFDFGSLVCDTNCVIHISDTSDIIVDTDTIHVSSSTPNTREVFVKDPVKLLVVKKTQDLSLLRNKVNVLIYVDA